MVNPHGMAVFNRIDDLQKDFLDQSIVTEILPVSTSE